MWGPAAGPYVRFMVNSTLLAPRPSASAPAVALRDVRKVYGRGDGAVVALDGVSAAISPGSFTAIMGPSGSGKSTFLNVAAGLDRPTSGSVALGDIDQEHLSERRLTILRRERAGFVFQAFNLLPSLTVAQNIALPLRLDGRRPRRSAVGEIAARVGLDKRLRDRPAQLSGGQQQLGPFFVVMIFAFTSIAVLNTLIMIALPRRRELALLRLVGATTRQVQSMVRWEATLIITIGLGIGLAIAATALLPLSHALTGGLSPYVPAGWLAAILGVSALLALVALSVPTRLALRTRPVEAIGIRE